MKDEFNITDFIDAMRSWPPYRVLRRLSPEEVQKLRTDLIPEASKLSSIGKHWEKFWSDFQEGDEVYEYSKSQEFWDAGLGHSGYIIKRQEAIVARFRTSWN